MYNVILCEGNSDRILLSYYIMSVSGYEYESSGKLPSFGFDAENFSWYKRDKQFLIMVAVTGSDFSAVLEKLLSFTQAEEKNRGIGKIVIVTDNDDDNSVRQRLEKIKNVFDKYQVSVDSADGQVWDCCRYRNKFFDECILEKLIVLQPKDEAGNLETFILSMMSDKDENDKQLIEQVKVFIENLCSEKYLRKRREKLKAELSVTFSIISPTHIFQKINKILKDIDWSQYSRFNEQYKELSLLLK